MKKIISIGISAFMLLFFTGCWSTITTGVGLNGKITKMCFPLSHKKELKCPNGMLEMSIVKQTVCIGFTDLLDRNPDYTCYQADIIKD